MNVVLCCHCSRQLLRQLSRPSVAALVTPMQVRRMPLDGHRYVKPGLNKNPSVAQKMPLAGRGKFGSLWKSLAFNYYELKDPSAYTVFWKDGVSFRKHLLIYRGDWDRVIMVSFTVVSTLLFIFILSGTIFMPDPSTWDDYDPHDEMDNLFHIYLLSFTLLTWFVIGHLACRRYVVRMYYDKNAKEFVIVTINNFLPWKVRTCVAKAGEGKLVTNPWLDWITGSVQVADGRKFNVRIQDFKFPVYYNILMGYQPPEDIDSVRDSAMDEADRYTGGQIHVNKPGFVKDDIGTIFRMKREHVELEKTRED